MLNELKLFELKKYKDTRGYFQETYNKIIKDEICFSPQQDNESLSKKGVIRGMHYQWDDPMGKLVRCSYGRIIDVVVDIRKNSKNFSKVYYFELSHENSSCLWIPPGFAHGFEVLSDFALVNYKCSCLYNHKGESGIDIYDKDLKINWLTKNPIVSEKDLVAKSFFEYSKDCKF